ncbi:MAG: rod-binding protein [Sphingorhabdus sp.]
MTQPIGSVGTNMPTTKSDPSLRKAAEGFEAVLVRQMISTMRKAKLADAMFGSSATDSFRELADAKTADSIAKLGSFGIADLIERQLSPPGGKKP